MHLKLQKLHAFAMWRTNNLPDFMSNQSETPKPPGTHLPCPDMGRMLKTHLKKRRMTKASLSENLGIHRTGVGRMLKRDTIQTDALWEACHTLRYNFFADLAAMLPAEYESEAVGRARAELEEVKKERDLLKGMLMGR